MTIDELNALTTLTAADEVPVWDSEESGEPTKKITASNLAASVKSLADLPNTTEMNAAIQQSTAFDTLFHKVNNVSGTTDANGNLLLPTIETVVRNVIIFVWDGVHVFIPFYYRGNWYCRVQQSNADGDAYANQNVTCSYCYI